MNITSKLLLRNLEKSGKITLGEEWSPETSNVILKIPKLISPTWPSLNLQTTCWWHLKSHFQGFVVYFRNFEVKSETFKKCPSFDHTRTTSFSRDSVQLTRRFQRWNIGNWFVKYRKLIPENPLWKYEILSISCKCLMHSPTSSFFSAVNIHHTEISYEDTIFPISMK